MNKELINKILQILAEQSPYSVDLTSYSLCDQQTLARHLKFLAQEQLIIPTNVVDEFSDGSVFIENCEITSKGWEFIKQDAGIRKEINTITVSLSEDTIKALLIQNIQQTDQPQDQKDRLINAIKDTPAEAWKSIVGQIVEQSLGYSPNIWSALSQLLL